MNYFSFKKSGVFLILLFIGSQTAIGAIRHFANPQGTQTNIDYASKCKADGWNVDLLNTASSSDFLSDEEKNLILATNMVRSNPAKFAELYVKELLGYYRGKQILYPMEDPVTTKEGITPASQLYRILLRTKPMGILTPSEGMSLAALDLAQRQSISGRTGHEDRNSLNRRLSQFGKWRGCIAENIAYGYTSGHYALLALLIDDGVPSRGHRQAILNPEFQMIGIGSATHKRYGWSFVIAYACDYTDTLK
jgi:hypothetical protein